MGRPVEVRGVSGVGVGYDDTGCASALSEHDTTAIRHSAVRGSSLGDALRRELENESAL